WLANLVAAFQRYDCAGIGGRIRLEWNCKPPKWLQLAGPYGIASVLVNFDLGEEPRVLRVAPFGANMAFRRQMFERYGCFRTDLGPTVGSEIRGEDSEFCRRLMAGGEEIRYEPSVVVYHPVPEDRLKREYFQAWFFDHGRALLRESGVPSGAQSYHGVPRYLLRALANRAIKWWVSRRSYVRFYHKLRVWRIAG